MSVLSILVIKLFLCSLFHVRLCAFEIKKIPQKLASEVSRQPGKKIDDKEDTSQRKYDIVQWGSMYQNQFEVISARYIDIKLCHIYLTSFLHARFIASQKAVW